MGCRGKAASLGHWRSRPPGSSKKISIWEGLEHVKEEHPVSGGERAGNRVSFIVKKFMPVVPGHGLENVRDRTTHACTCTVQHLGLDRTLMVA